MTKRVLHIFGAMNRGGAEMRTVSLMGRMNTRGIQFDYCVLSGEKGVLDEQIRESGGNIYYCKLGPAFICRFIALLRRYKFDAVHSHVAYVSGFILLLAKLSGVKKRVAHFRNTTAGSSGSIFRNSRDYVLKLLIKFFSTDILAVCVGAMKGFWGENWQTEARCKVMYNGFEIPNKIKEIDFWKNHIPGYSGQKVVINVARMDIQKNHLRQCDIFNELNKLNDNVCMVFIGKEDPQKKELMLEKNQTNGIENKFHFLGLQSDVLSFLVNADVMLFPSEWEGLPGVVLEAASVNLPVVGSDLPGIEEISEQLPNIHIVKRLDANNVWADKLAKVLLHEDKEGSMLKAFLKSDFLIENNITLLDAIYSR